MKVESDDLIGQKEFAEILGWDRRRVSTYYWRGKLPEPIKKLASGPVWTRQQAEEYKRLHDAS